MKNKKGFTFFEVAVSLAVLAIGISGFLAIFSTSLIVSRETKHSLIGPEIAKSAASIVSSKKIVPREVPYDHPEKISGYYVSILAGRLDQFKFNNEDIGDRIIFKRSIFGNTGINPNNSEDMYIKMKVVSGPNGKEMITRSDLLERDKNVPTGRNKYGGGDLYLVTYIRFMPKGGANSNYIIYDGDEIILKPNKTYTFVATENNPMRVRLFNSHHNNSGTAMGRWWFEVEGDDVVEVNENMDGGGDSAGDLVTLKVEVYETKRDLEQKVRSVGTYFIRTWVRK